MPTCKHRDTTSAKIVLLLVLMALAEALTGLSRHPHSSIDSVSSPDTMMLQHHTVQHQPAAYSRKLLQQLPLARETNINRLSRLAAVAGTDSSDAAQITAASGARLGFNVLSNNFGANGYLGGLVKGTQIYRGATTRNSAETSSSVRYTSLSDPSFGSTTSRTGSDSVVLLQKAISPAVNSSSSNGNNGNGSNHRSKDSSRASSNNSSVGSGRASPSSKGSEAQQSGVSPAPAPSQPINLDILMAANLDYSISGDSAVVLFRDYSLPNLDPTTRCKLDPYSLDYDYGQPHLLPQTATSATNQAAKLDADGGRAMSKGSTSALATGQAVTARTHSTSSSLRGTVSARRNNDTFVRPGATTPSQTVTPPVPLVQSGADAAGAGSAKQYTASLFPSVAFGSSTAHSNTDSTPGGGGAVSDVLSYTSGTQAISSRTQTLAVGGCVGLDFC